MVSTKKNICRNSPTLNTKGVVGRHLYYPDASDGLTIHGGMRLNGEFKSTRDMLPLVSVITVCKDSVATIEDCIKSIFDQSYENIEYIVVDGASKDGTVELLAKNSEAIDYYISEPDQGLYQAMNKGLTLATGSYILFLNSDDCYYSPCIKSLVDAKKYSGVDFVSSLIDIVDGSGNFVQVSRAMAYDQSICLRMSLRHETMLVSSTIYNEIGAYSEKYKIIADLEFAIRLYKAGYTHYCVNVPLLVFKNTGVSSNTEKLVAERVGLLSSQFGFLNEKELYMLAEVNKQSRDKLISLERKYSDFHSFVMTIFLYLEERKLNSSLAKWNDSNLGVDYRSIIKTPKVSVILPVFNAEESLGRCLCSLNAQTLSDIEIICIDDASQDGSVDIAKQFSLRDNRLRIFQNMQNIGLGATRNKGVGLAKGAYVFHIDPDDTIPENALEILYKKAIYHGSEIVKGSYISEQYHFGLRPNQKRISFLENQDQLINISLHDQNTFLKYLQAHVSCIYRYDIAKRVPYPIDLKMGQDAIFMVNALTQTKKITVIDDVVYHYLVNHNSSTNVFKFQKYLDVLEWRRRAWFVLRDAGLKGVGDKLIKNYFCVRWHQEFLEYYRKNRDEREIQVLFCVIAKVLKETGVSVVVRELAAFTQIFCDFLNISEHEAERIVLNRLQHAMEFGSIGMKNSEEYANRIDIFDERNKYQDAKKPKVSVILPIYNAQDTLGESIESILSQSLIDFELICIDDLSKDGSYEIIQKYATFDSRIVHIVNYDNIGHGATRNKGVRVARGDYIFHVDPDDTVPSSALETLYKSAIEYGSEIVRGACLKSQSTHRVQNSGKQRVSLADGLSVIVNTNLKAMPTMLGTTEGHTTCLYQREFAKNNLYPEDLEMGQDSIFLVSALVNASKVTIVDEVVYNYQKNVNSAMNTFTYSKYLDALEWRRRAWHVLNGVGMREIGDYLLRDYWSKQFFYEMEFCLSKSQQCDIFSKFKGAFKEAELTNAGTSLPVEIRNIVDNILKHEYDEAHKCIHEFAMSK